MNSTHTFASLFFVGAVTIVSGSSYAQEEEPSNLARLYGRVATSIVLVTDGIDDYKSFGSGVVVHKGGYIVSAAHVVDRADRIGIEFKTGEKAEAKIVTLSEHQDLVLLKVDKLPEGVAIARLGDSSQVQPGQQVFCIGAPRGLRFSISAGIVSAIRTHVGNRYRLHSPDELIQTDAAVNPGNSGGALFSMQGEVIGIAVKTVTGGNHSDSAGLGLAVPSNVVRDRLFDDALPYRGMLLQRISPTLAEVMNWPPFEALLVEGVRKGSNAEKAGLRGGRYHGNVGNIELIFGGDVIYEIGGISVAEIEKVHAHLHGLKSGDKIKYTVLRTGKIFAIDVDVEHVAPIPNLEPVHQSKAARAVAEDIWSPPVPPDEDPARAAAPGADEPRVEASGER